MTPPVAGNSNMMLMCAQRWRGTLNVVNSKNTARVCESIETTENHGYTLTCGTKKQGHKHSAENSICRNLEKQSPVDGRHIKHNKEAVQHTYPFVLFQLIEHQSGYVGVRSELGDVSTGAVRSVLTCERHLKMSSKNLQNFHKYQWRIQDFPDEGAPTPQHTILPNFPSRP